MPPAPPLARALGLCLATGCAAPAAVVPATPAPARAAEAPAAPRCPSAPRLEWHALRPPEGTDGAVAGDGGPPDGWRAGAPLWLAGQVRSVDLEAFEGGQSLVGSLTAKGQARLERGTRALAVAAARQTDGPTPWMGVCLDGEVVAALPVRQMIRGRNFRVPTVAGWPPSEAPVEALGVRLRAAAEEDRRCFGALGPDEPDGAARDAAQKRFALEPGRR